MMFRTRSSSIGLQMTPLVSVNECMGIFLQ
uniref:Uncharacterized protein n=1 Tax=Arundo donax TaxID=35708 RepID=A0A0A9EUP7_ARUDO